MPTLEERGFDLCGEKEYCFTVLVLRTKHLLIVQNRHIFLFLACRMRIESSTNLLGLFAQRYFGESYLGDGRDHGIEIMRRKHCWLRENKLEHWIAGYIGPVVLAKVLA